MRGTVTKTATGIPGVRKATRTYPDGRAPVVKYEAYAKDALGKVQHLGTYDKREEARAVAIEARAAVQANTFVSKAAGKAPFLQVAEAWLATPHVQGLKPSTRYGYRNLVHGEHLRALHHKPVSGIGYDECSAAVGNVLASHARSTAGHVLHVLRLVLDHAVKAGYVKANPARLVKAGSKQKAPLIPLDFEDVERIILALPDARGPRLDRWRLYVELAADSGCRAGELCGLRVRHLEISGRRLRVEETAREVGGELVTGPPKTKAGRRVVDGLNPDLCLRLSSHVEGMSPDDYVFGEGALPLRHSNFGNRVFKPTVKALGLPRARFHDLRHFAASAHLLLVGEGRVGEVAKRLGHSKPSVTLDVYGHVLDHQSRDVSAALADLRAAARARVTGAEPPTPEPAASVTAGGVVDLAAWRTRRTG